LKLLYLEGCQRHLLSNGILCGSFCEGILAYHTTAVLLLHYYSSILPKLEDDNFHTPPWEAIELKQTKTSFPKILELPHAFFAQPHPSVSTPISKCFALLLDMDFPITEVGILQTISIKPAIIIHAHGTWDQNTEFSGIMLDMCT